MRSLESLLFSGAGDSLFVISILGKSHPCDTTNGSCIGDRTSLRIYQTRPRAREQLLRC